VNATAQVKMTESDIVVRYQKRAHGPLCNRVMLSKLGFLGGLNGYPLLIAAGFDMREMVIVSC
jgi:hypothetical protein